ncbi:MAG TPA: class I SAM-dependent rRNA methyltransferase, partial [Ignavibacteria bacterium]|nr:class I SAM-dependent rRNA methyltransferase [Ignavibacteria bacterium]
MQPKVYLNKNEEYRIKAGHLWAFSNEIKNVENSPENGDLVELYDFRNNFLGTGFYNKNSLISIRLLSDKRIEDFYSFAEAKILRAYNLRKQFYPGRESFRMVFSESDFLPGLIIDKYNSSFVLQVYSFGMQKNLDKIVGILKREFGAKNIFTKNKEYFRKLEGLPVENEILSGSIENETINDGAIKYLIDFEKGHKTGFYFDQCDNRFFIERIVKGKNVLDGFCNSGGFGLHAAKAGASFVTFVDSSSTEIENAKRNFELNQLKIDSEFHNSDVFDYCNECIKSEKKFDVVMIDPPAFAKSKKDLRAA